MTYNTHTDTEIDRLVAERLGVRFYGEPIAVGETAETFYHRSHWSPSTRIEQAMGLLEGLQYTMGTDQDRYMASLQGRGECIDVSSRAKAETLERAICEAWLAWKDAEGGR